MSSERISVSKSFVARLRERVTSLYDALRPANPSLLPSAGDSQETLGDKFFGLLTALGVRGSSSAVSVATIADLRLLDTSNLANGTVIHVAGYYSAGDGGGGSFRIDTTDTASADDGGSVIATASGARAKAVWAADGAIPAARWGVLGTEFGGVECAAQLNRAITYTSARGGGFIQLPPGIISISDQITLKQNVHLAGFDSDTYSDGVSVTPGTPPYRAGLATMLFMNTNVNKSMVVFDNTGGYVRQTNIAVWDGELVAEARNVNASVRNVVFKRHSVQADYKPQVFAKDCWGLVIEGCKFDFAGYTYPVHLRNCNGFRVLRNTWSGYWGSFLLEDCADGTVEQNFFYGAVGPVCHVLASWKNGINNNQFGNAVNTNSPSSLPAGEYKSDWTVTVSGDVFTTSGNHLWYTGQLVYLSSTGSVPTGTLTTRPYYIIRLSNTTFSLASSYPNALAGTVLTLGSVGSGTITASRGPTVGLFMCAPAGSNSGRFNVVGNRFDQHYTSAIELWGWHSSLFVGNYFVENSFNNSSKFPAVKVSKGTTRCVFSGTATDTVSSCSYIFEVDDNCDHNTFGAVSGTSVSGEYSFGATGTSNNRVALDRSPAGVASIGGAAVGNALTLTGNASGVRVLRLSRPSLSQDVGIGVALGGFNFWDETNGRAVGQLTRDVGGAYLTFSGAAEATPLQAGIRGMHASGTDVSGGKLQLYAGAGTGNAASADVEVMMALPGASGTAAQAHARRWRFNAPPSPSTNDTVAMLFFWDGSAWNERRMVVGAADSAGSGFRTLRCAN